jgi:ribonuclease T2
MVFVGNLPVYIGPMRAMIKRFRRAGLTLALTLAAPAAAQGFDYYLLALSWSPSWCAAEGDARDAEQCDPARDLGFILHGLWPQHEDGWPEFCDPAHADPSRRDTAAMADIMGSGGLAWHQWQKHGRCSGLAARDYFALARRAYAAVARPPLDPPRATAASVELAFLDANPALAPEHLIVTCRDGRIAEVRVCLARGLDPRPCAPDVARDACTRAGALHLPPIR